MTRAATQSALGTAPSIAKPSIKSMVSPCTSDYADSTSVSSTSVSTAVKLPCSMPRRMTFRSRPFVAAAGSLKMGADGAGDGADAALTGPRPGKQLSQRRTCEAIYANMPRFGLSATVSHVPVGKRRETALGRLKA